MSNTDKIEEPIKNNSGMVMDDPDCFYVPRDFILDPIHRKTIGHKIWVYYCTLADPDFTVKSISQDLDMFPSRVRLHLRSLAKHGYIKYIKAFAKQDSKQRIPRKLRWEIWNRDNFKCQNCESSYDLTIDHIVSEHHGGDLNPDNLQTLCRPCNSSKGIK